MVCFACHARVDHAQACANFPACEAMLCPLCRPPHGLCGECLDEESMFRRREPRCARTRTDAASCDCVEIDEVKL